MELVFQEHLPRTKGNIWKDIFNFFFIHVKRN